MESVWPCASDIVSSQYTVPAVMEVVSQTPNGNVGLSGPLSLAHYEDLCFPSGPAVKNPCAMQEPQETGV